MRAMRIVDEKRDGCKGWMDDEKRENSSFPRLSCRPPLFQFFALMCITSNHNRANRKTTYDSFCPSPHLRHAFIPMHVTTTPIGSYERKKQSQTQYNCALLRQFFK